MWVSDVSVRVGSAWVGEHACLQEDDQFAAMYSSIVLYVRLDVDTAEVYGLRCSSMSLFVTQIENTRCKLNKTSGACMKFLNTYTSTTFK